MSIGPSAERPYAFVSLESAGLGEFRHRSYNEAACDHLPNLVDPMAARAAFEVAIESRFEARTHDLRESPAAELLAFTSGKPSTALTALAEMARRELARKDIYAAGGVARRALPLLKDNPDAATVVDALSIVEAY